MQASTRTVIGMQRVEDLTTELEGGGDSADSEVSTVSTTSGGPLNMFAFPESSPRLAYNRRSRPGPRSRFDVRTLVVFYLFTRNHSLGTPLYHGLYPQWPVHVACLARVILCDRERLWYLRPLTPLTKVG